MKNFYVYIITNYTNTTFYVGITSNLEKRMLQHKTKCLEGFSSRYNLKKLIYFEIYDDSQTAIYREKQLKKYRRVWKINLIRRKNSRFQDLSLNWFEGPDARTSLA